jgi:hypothetical protein
MSDQDKISQIQALLVAFDSEEIDDTKLIDFIRETLDGKALSMADVYQ